MDAFVTKISLKLKRIDAGELIIISLD